MKGSFDSIHSFIQNPIRIPILHQNWTTPILKSAPVTELSANNKLPIVFVEIVDFIQANILSFANLE